VIALAERASCHRSGCTCSRARPRPRRSATPLATSKRGVRNPSRWRAGSRATR